jgi:hypothetical protein
MDSEAPLLLWILVSLGMFIGSIALVVFFLTRLPATYFRPSQARDFMPDRHWALRSGAVVAKNAIGVLLVLLGIVMALPGVPGQGMFTMLVGLMLVDFPGRRALEYKLISRPNVLRAVNRLRRTFSRPPFVLE